MPDVGQEPEPVADLLEDLAGDLALARREAQAREELGRFGHRVRSHRVDGAAADADRQRLGPQPPPLARRAGLGRHVRLELRASRGSRSRGTGARAPAPGPRTARWYSPRSATKANRISSSPEPKRITCCAGFGSFANGCPGGTSSASRASASGASASAEPASGPRSRRRRSTFRSPRPAAPGPP